jgi:hypothetical protein
VLSHADLCILALTLALSEEKTEDVPEITTIPEVVCSSFLSMIIYPHVRSYRFRPLPRVRKRSSTLLQMPHPLSFLQGRPWRSRCGIWPWMTSRL